MTHLVILRFVCSFSHERYELVKVLKQWEIVSNNLFKLFFLSKSFNMSGTLQDYFEALPFSLYPKPYIVGREFQRADNVRLRNKTLCIGDFTIIKRIGEGSYGKVYKAKDSSNKLVDKSLF